MNDLMFRLRLDGPLHETRLEAADEIERLRATISFYGDHLNYGAARFVGAVPGVIKDGGRLARLTLAGNGREED